MPVVPVVLGGVKWQNRNFFIFFLAPKKHHPAFFLKIDN
jgi:hypothetical protein